jgi:hypothetical protein
MVALASCRNESDVYLDKSSRAHTLFKLTIESKQRGSGGKGSVRIGTLSLCDLAGSENAKLTNSSGVRATEGVFCSNVYHSFFVPLFVILILIVTVILIVIVTVLWGFSFSLLQLSSSTVRCSL